MKSCCLINYTSILKESKDISRSAILEKCWRKRTTTDRWTVGPMNEWMHGWKDGAMDERMDGRSDEWVDGRTDGWMFSSLTAMHECTGSLLKGRKEKNKRSSSLKIVSCLVFLAFLARKSNDTFITFLWPIESNR